MSILYTALNNILWFLKIVTWAKAVIPLSDKHALLLNNETWKMTPKLIKYIQPCPECTFFCF